jgi:hypothetical protein
MRDGGPHALDGAHDGAGIGVEEIPIAHRLIALVEQRRFSAPCVRQQLHAHTMRIRK